MGLFCGGLEEFMGWMRGVRGDFDGKQFHIPIGGLTSRIHQKRILKANSAPAN